MSMAILHIAAPQPRDNQKLSVLDMDHVCLSANLTQSSS